MGAGIGRPRPSATKAGLSRLSQELRAENWGPPGPAPRAAAATAAAHDSVPAPTSGPRAHRRVETDDEDDDGDVDDMLGVLPADLGYAAGFDSSSDDEADVGSVAKLARVRKLMERPVDDAGTGKRMTDREVRAMLSEASRSCQRLAMLQFVKECTQRLDEDDGMEKMCAVRCCHACNVLACTFWPGQSMNFHWY